MSDTNTNAAIDFAPLLAAVKDGADFAQLLSELIQCAIEQGTLRASDAHGAVMLGVFGSARARGVPWRTIIDQINLVIDALRKTEYAEANPDERPTGIILPDGGSLN